MKTAKIYKIVNNKDDNFYIGSTRETYLSKRWGKHRAYKNHIHYKEGSKNLLWKHFDSIGFDNFQIVLLEECEKDKQMDREQYYIKMLKPQLNHNNAKGVDLENKKKLGKKHYKENKQYYVDYGQKEKICECGMSVSYWSMYHHKRSKIHQKLMTTKENLN